MSAASNLPSGRDGGVGWTDSNGNLWMFGGFNYAAAPITGYLQNFNDLWEFSPSTKEWRLMGGSQIPN
jgi:N-acetylneuraminic acid mutarotase